MNDGLEPCLPENVNVARVFFQTIGTQSQLVRRLLAGDVERRDPLILESCRALHQESGFANARFAADEGDGARYDSPAQHEIEFRQSGAPALFADGWKVGKLDRNCGSFFPTFQPSNLLPDRLLHQRIPRTTTVAAATPLRLIRATLGAAEDRLAFRHVQPRTGRGLRARCSCRSACIPS